MKIVHLDLTDCKYIDDLHERIRVAFDFPKWYGANWSAFWDLLWSDCDADRVIITGEHTMPKEFDESLAKMHKILDRMIQFCEDTEHPFSYEIRNEKGAQAMKIVHLNLTDCKYIDDLHERIRVAFDFPEWYGENWDAFWDLLWRECDADKVIITGEHTMPKEFDRELAVMHELLEKRKTWDEEHGYPPFLYEIRN